MVYKQNLIKSWQIILEVVESIVFNEDSSDEGLWEEIEAEADWGIPL